MQVTYISRKGFMCWVWFKNAWKWIENLVHYLLEYFTSAGVGASPSQQAMNLVKGTLWQTVHFVLWYSVHKPGSTTLSYTFYTGYCKHELSANLSNTNSAQMILNQLGLLREIKWFIEILLLDLYSLCCW